MATVVHGRTLLSEVPDSSSDSLVCTKRIRLLKAETMKRLYLGLVVVRDLSAGLA